MSLYKSKNKDLFKDKFSYFQSIFSNYNLEYDERLSLLKKEISVYYELEPFIVERLFENISRADSIFYNFNLMNDFKRYLLSRDDLKLIHKNKLILISEFSVYFYLYFVKHLELMSEVLVVVLLLKDRTNLESFLMRFYQDNGMYCLLTDDFLDALAKSLKGKRVLEVCGGQGFLSRGLHNRGINIICTDNYSWDSHLKVGVNKKFRIENLDAVSSLKKYKNDIDVLLVSWVPYDSTLDYELLSYIRQEAPHIKFFVIGEGYGGCTGSEKLFEFGEYDLENVSDYVNDYKDCWYSIGDKLYIFK